MRTLILFLLVYTAASAQAPQVEQPRTTPPGMGQGPGEPQKMYGQALGKVLLVTPKTATELVEKFRAKYDAPTAPRIVIYVNRRLIVTDSKTGGALRSPATPEGLSADEARVRDVERLFGRVFRNAGAKLADAKVAVDMLAQTPEERLTGDNAAKQRQALLEVADIAVEVLISNKQITVPGVSADQVVEIPEIQATAIRLKDAAIVGQASASDILGKDLQAIRIARTYDSLDITEATALALMEDMLTGK